MRQSGDNYGSVKYSPTRTYRLYRQDLYFGQ